MQERFYQLLGELLISDKRESALAELSKKRDLFVNVAPILWHSTGAVTVLIEEVVSVYDLLTPTGLSGAKSNRVCHSLALLQCLATHPETRSLFLNSHIPLFLYPFLNTVTKNKSFEFLRLTSLGVIGALVKSDDPEVISFLLSTEIIPLCLRIMETGSELSKTVATFIVQKILLFDVGLNYICQTADRFYAVSQVLANMTNDSPSPRLLKHIIRCYLRLADHARAREALRGCIPLSLRDNTFEEAFKEDEVMRRWLIQLLTALGGFDLNFQGVHQVYGGGASAGGVVPPQVNTAGGGGQGIKY